MSIEPISDGFPCQPKNEAALFEKYRHSARRVAAQYLNSTSEADDVIAVAFAKVRAAVSRGTGPRVEAYWSYLRTTVRNEAIDLMRRCASERRAFVEYASTCPTSLDDVGALFARVDAKFLEIAVSEAFSQLSDRDKQVLRLRVIESRSTVEAGKAMGLSPDGVAAATYRAKKQLRQNYARQRVEMTARTGWEVDRDPILRQVFVDVERRLSA